MGELTGFTRSYLAPAPDSPWTWADGGKVLCWSTGATIAFLPEVRAVLARVAREAEVVPPFLAVALLLHALRQEPRGTLGAELTAWLRAELEGGEAAPRTRMVALLSVPHLERGLGALAGVPAAFWTRADAKELVAVAVLGAGCVRRDPSQAALLARALEHGLPPWSFAPRAEVASRRVEAWSEAISILLHGLARFEPEALLLRARTGLEALPAPAELALEVRGGARELIDELREDEELTEVAGLARRLLATLHVPRPIAAREDLPIGGVSDIANRGSFERLLASELAHDDLTLAVRIALNEALYTRRESPPRPRTGARCVLVDAGIRMWGLPRVFAAAVALALAAGAERGRTVAVWRTGARLEPVDLTRRAGLVELLAALDAAPHPAASVEPFLAELERAGPGSEAFLVTHARALADPGFRAAAQRLGAAPVHAVLVDGAGNLRVQARTPRGARTVHEARLDLTALLRRPAAEPLLPPSAHELPAFLRVLPSPLLLPLGLQHAWLAAAPGGSVVAWTGEQELAHWTSDERCARVLAHLPGPRRVWLFECTDDGVVHLVKSDHEKRVLWLRHDLLAGTSAVERVADEPAGLQAAVRFGADLVLACQREAWLIEGAGGEPRVTQLAATWLGGRRFRTRAHALAQLRLAPGGGSFEPLPCVFPAGAAELLACCERRQRADEPWGLARIGHELHAFATQTGESVRLQGEHLPDGVRFTRASADGERVCDHAGRWLIDFRTRSVTRATPEAAFSALRRRPWHPLRIGMRTRLRGVGVATDGRLLLSDRRGKVLAFRPYGSNGTGMIELGLDDDGQVARLVPFERARLGDGRIAGEALSRRGDRVYLDGRGLLHLVPAQGTGPQLAVLLPTDRCTGIWSSDGRVHGPSFFTGAEGPGADAQAMLALLAEFARGFA